MNRFAESVVGDAALYLLTQFADATRPLLARITQNEQGSRIFVSRRGTLLSKLISEIRVRNLGQVAT